MKQVTYKIDELMDMMADENTQVEIQKETGSKDRYKLYIHHEGKSVVRVCKLLPSQFILPKTLTIR